jgi:putative flippase GtrA
MLLQKLYRFLKENFRLLCKYLGSGLLSVLADYLVFLCLTQLGFFYLYAVTISYLCGLLLNFYLNKLWTFQRKDNTLPQMVRYFTLAGVNYLLTLLLMYLFTSLLGINPLLSRGVVLAMVSSWNFLLYKYVVYR